MKHDRPVCCFWSWPLYGGRAWMAQLANEVGGDARRALAVKQNRCCDARRTPRASDRVAHLLQQIPEPGTWTGHRSPDRRLQFDRQDESVVNGRNEP